jgi:hypothetical protein
VWRNQDKKNMIYQLYLDDILLISAFKTSGSKFKLILRDNMQDKNTEILGKLRSNFFKSEYNIFDNGRQVKSANKTDKQSLNLGAIVIVNIY